MCRALCNVESFSGNSSIQGMTKATGRSGRWQLFLPVRGSLSLLHGNYIRALSVAAVVHGIDGQVIADTNVQTVDVKMSGVINLIVVPQPVGAHAISNDVKIRILRT